MKILHVVSSVDPSQGGVAESIVRRGERLVQMGHEVEVASLDDPCSDIVNNYILPLYALGPGITQWCYSKKLLPWLLDNAKKYDIVVIDGIWQYNGYAVYKALRGTGVPYIVFTHGMLDPWFKKEYPFKHLKKWIFWPWAQYRMLRDAKAVLFTCEEERELAGKSFWLYKVKPLVVPFGTYIPDFNKNNAKEEFYEKFPDVKGRKMLLFLGRVHPKKGCDILIESFYKINQMDPDLVLGIAGPGDKNIINELKILINERNLVNKVFWFDMVSGSLKWGAFCASYGFILPSHQENFGIAVAEAMGCGVPVLISDKVNIWREILQGEAGFVDSDTVDGTCRNIEKLLKLDDKRYNEMCRSSFLAYEEKFTIDAMAEGFLSAVHGILKGNNPSH